NCDRFSEGSTDAVSGIGRAETQVMNMRTVKLQKRRDRCRLGLVGHDASRDLFDGSGDWRAARKINRTSKGLKGRYERENTDLEPQMALQTGGDLASSSRKYASATRVSTPLRAKGLAIRRQAVSLNVWLGSPGSRHKTSLDPVEEDHHSLVAMAKLRARD